MATAIAIVNNSLRRLDDRLSTFGNTEFFECAPDITVLPPGRIRRYGTALVGLTSTSGVSGPLIMVTLEVWNFGVHVSRSQLFPGGIPPGYEDLLWDVWFSSREFSFSLLVAGVQI